MDIYVISTFIQPAIRIILYQKLNINFTVYIIFSTITIVVISIILSKFIVRKSRFIRKIVVGI